MLVGVSAGTSGAFTQGFCGGDSRLECPREGTSHLIFCTTGAPDPTRNSESQDAPSSHGWLRAQGAVNPITSKGAPVPQGAPALGVPRVLLGVQL